MEGGGVKRIKKGKEQIGKFLKNRNGETSKSTGQLRSRWRE